MYKNNVQDIQTSNVFVGGELKRVESKERISQLEKERKML
jgi:hypothetical protein